MTRRDRLRDEAGMTVVEMAVATALFMIILFAVFSALDSGSRAERGQQARKDALIELRQAMTRLTRDLREAVAIDPTSTHQVLTMTTLVAGVDTKVTYSLHETPAGSSVFELRRQVESSAAQAIVTNMVIDTTANPDPPFCYSFDSSATPPQCVDGGVVPTTLTAVRITLAKDPEFNPGEPITLATDVELRNL